MTPTMNLGGSFKIANEAAPRRLVVAIDGLEKEGKTHFALTAPGPIFYQAFDDGAEGVVEKVQTSKVIHRADYIVPFQDASLSQEQLQAKCEEIVKQWLLDYKLGMASLNAGITRTGILDTATETWDTFRLARLGKLTQVMPHQYVKVNTEFRSIIREVYNTPGNLILLHKLKPEWKEGAGGKSNKTGKHERSGFSDTGFLVQVNCTAWREPGNGAFHLTVQNCRQNPGIAGLDLEGDMATFPWLGVNVYPETSLEDWM